MSQRMGVVIAMVLALAACGNEPTAVGNERIGAVQEPNGVRLTNLSDHATAYAIIDKNTLMLIDWAPCRTTTPDCLRLPAKGSVVVPFSEIVGYAGAGTEVAIYSWWVLTDPMGLPYVDQGATLSLKF